MNSLEHGRTLKEAGKKYVTVYGKTFVSSESPEYMRLRNFSQLLVKHDLGVIHGGYIGLMEAISEGANNAILAKGLSNNYNLGIPEITFEQNNIPKSNALHTVPADGILDRVNTLIQLSDFIVVAEKGGFGTLLEAIATFHMNQLNKKFGGEVRPLIFVGSIWKDLFTEMIDKLDMYNQDNGSDSTNFVETYEEAFELITKVNRS